MSHVDDGVLHAYLDGGLSALDAVRVERHVADCGACQLRLDQARGLIQRAARLLEWASPPADRAAPPLADLRPAVGGAPRWRVPVAWAATIVVALGVGIYGGQRLLSGGRETDQRYSSSDVATQKANEESGFADSRRATPITVVADAESGSAQRQDAAKTPAAAPAPVATTEPQAPTNIASGIAPRDSVALNRVAQATPAQPRPDSTAVRAKLDSNATLALGSRREAAATIRSFNAPTPPAAGDTAAARERRAAAPEAAASSGQLYRAETTVWPVIGIDSARVLLGTAPVSLPDFPVNAIRTQNGVVAVDQVVPPGRVIRLLQRRANTDEAQVRTLSDLLARYVDGMRVEISGPMPPDSLSKLLERVRAIP